MDHLSHHVGVVLVCETCETEVDLPDEHAERGVCRQCGIAFLLDVPPVQAARAS